MKRIGEILIEKGFIKPEELNLALELQKKVGGYLGQILIREGLITEKHLIVALSEQLGLPVFDPNEYPDLYPVTQLDSKILELLLKNNFVPLKVPSDDKIYLCLTNDPLNFPIKELVARSLPASPKFFLAEEVQIREYARLYREGTSFSDIVDLEESVERLKEIASEAPVIKYLNQLLTQAVELRATDIHIEPIGSVFRVRFRIDGILHEMETLEKSFYLALVSRIKLLAGLDIAEKRLPQDGKFTTRIASHYIDIRVSTIPMIKGESVVMRLLYKESLSFSIGKLGLEKDHQELLLHLVSKPYGMILITGPTGSGKTTTLYTLLSRLNNRERKIITVEDPVEYQLEGINQIQVKPEIGLTFAHALRSILRHDPDVIMIGEIRDRETAEIAIHSALTGHLVLSTLHTNDAPSALFRLLEMGIEDYLLNASILGVVAQRIVRKICPQCQTKITQEEAKLPFDPKDLISRYPYLFNGKSIELSQGKGCPYCVKTGYFGRIAIFEMFEYNDHLKEIFIKYKSLETLRHHLVNHYNFRTLREDGYIKVLHGVTTVEEVLRVT